MRRRAHVGGLVLAIALVVGACGGDGKKPTSAAASSSGSAADTGASSSSGGGSLSVDACALSESDISSIVGFPVQKRDGSSGSNCVFGRSEAAGDHHYSFFVRFTVTPFSGGAEDMRRAVDAETVKISAVEVSGVGDRAFFIDAGSIDDTVYLVGGSFGESELLVFTGTTEIAVAMGSLEEDIAARKELLIALAQKLLATPSTGSTADAASPSGGGSASVPACKLSEIVVSGIVGFAVDSFGFAVNTANRCNFGAVARSAVGEGSTGISATVDFSVTPFFGGDEGAKIEADDLASRIPPEEGPTSAIEVSGAGDRAFFIDTVHVGFLVVFSGQTQIVIQLADRRTAEPDSGRTDRLIALAKKMLS